MNNEKDPFICDQWEPRAGEADVQRSDKCCQGGVGGGGGGGRGWCGHHSHWWEYFNGAITGLTRTSLLPCLLMTRVSHFSLNILFQCLPLNFSL